MPHLARPEIRDPVAGQAGRLSRRQPVLRPVAEGLAGGEGHGDHHDADVDDHPPVGPAHEALAKYYERVGNQEEAERHRRHR